MEEGWKSLPLSYQTLRSLSETSPVHYHPLPSLPKETGEGRRWVSSIRSEVPVKDTSFAVAGRVVTVDPRPHPLSVKEASVPRTSSQNGRSSTREGEWGYREDGGKG